MVLMRLDQLNFLVDQKRCVPDGFPDRIKIIKKRFCDFQSNNNSLKVSIEVDPLLESCPVESELSNEVGEKFSKIVEDIILKIPIENTVNAGPFYLISEVSKCLECGAKVSVQNKRQIRTVVMYTRDHGSFESFAYQKTCSVCSATYHPNYYEITQKDGSVLRKFDKKDFLGVTERTYFETKFLDQVTEDLFTLDARFTAITEKYNNIFSEQHKELNRKRLELAWLVQNIIDRLPRHQFVISRKDKSGELDMEEICKSVYPVLKEFVDDKWLGHICSKCEDRIVILDGNAKLYR